MTRHLSGHLATCDYSGPNGGCPEFCGPFDRPAELQAALHADGWWRLGSDRGDPMAGRHLCPRHGAELAERAVAS